MKKIFIVSLFFLSGCANTFEQLDVNSCGYRQKDFSIFSECLEKKLTVKSNQNFQQSSNHSKANAMKSIDATQSLNNEFISNLRTINEAYIHDKATHSENISLKAAYDEFDVQLAEFRMIEQQNNQLIENSPSSNANNNAQMCVGLALLGMGGCNNGGVYTQPQQPPPPPVSPFVNCRTTRDYQGNLNTVCY
jgi:hypothetical protein